MRERERHKEKTKKQRDREKKGDRETVSEWNFSSTMDEKQSEDLFCLFLF